MTDVAIRVQGLCKQYPIYENPRDRLKQFVLPRLGGLVGKAPKQYYKEFWALRDISFEVKRGETVGIIGRNGSGKSTLLQIICGTLSPTSGTIETNGRIAALLELGSGFNPDFTGRENVYMNAALLGLSRDEIDDRFDDIAAFADIGEFIEQPVKTYSSGMLVRLAFAVIAHVDADILVIDEALAVGDAFFTQKCMRFLRQFMKTGTVLFVSHDTGAVVNLCSKAILLSQGEITKEGTPKNICEHYLETLFEIPALGNCVRKRARKMEIHEQAQIKDQRLKFINNSNLRNDLRIFTFNPDAPSFGNGGAQIHSVLLLDDDKSPLAWVVGDEKVTLQIRAIANRDIDSPILGFFVKDRLGQPLFGDNTFLSHRDQEIDCKAGNQIQVEFVFNMPLLPHGDYSITVAIANGTQESHEQLHWIHDAILFTSESSSVASGLVGIPMLEINFKNLGIGQRENL